MGSSSKIASSFASRMAMAMHSQFDEHVRHVGSLWQMQKAECNQLPPHRRSPHLVHSFVDFKVDLTEELDAETSEGSVSEDAFTSEDDDGTPLPHSAPPSQQAARRRSRSCPILATRAALDEAPAAGEEVEEQQPPTSPQPLLPEETEERKLGTDVASGDSSDAEVAPHAMEGITAGKECCGKYNTDCSDLLHTGGTPKSSWIRAYGVVTLQMHGVHPWLGVDKLLEALHSCGLQGWYNFVHIPRKVDGSGSGFAFINMRTVEAAAHLVESLDGWPLPARENGGQRVNFSAAWRQGYGACLQQVRKYKRVYNTVLHPFATTEDGKAMIMAPPEVVAAIAAGSLAASFSQSKC
mmetsp:Transcript_12396/g.29163  ORF Transcript_12396/g.29163 Transcript_12396/m.29163 type:complete len:352 (+) Transcript_12396:72-1127(+)